MPEFHDKHRATGILVAGVFHPYTSQDEADSFTASTAPVDSEKPSATDADQRTIAQLKTALDGAGVDYSAITKRADFVALAAEHSV